MKIIQELIAYFLEQGDLTPKQLKKLAAKGYWASEAPYCMSEQADQVGATFFYLVTGNHDGTVWGTDTYTSDSCLAASAIHAGLVREGKKAVVKVTIEEPLDEYYGTLRNGVESCDYGPYSGAYSLEGVS